jgi:hypothetical protein
MLWDGNSSVPAVRLRHTCFAVFVDVAALMIVPGACFSFVCFAATWLYEYGCEVAPAVGHYISRVQKQYVSSSATFRPWFPVPNRVPTLFLAVGEFHASHFLL